MRRIITIATAVVMLVGATAAYAALNSYSSGTSLSFSPSKAGSKKSPSSLGYLENLGAGNANPSLRAAPLINIETKIYGLVSNARYFPTCSGAKIDTAPGFNKNCSNGSHIGTGRVHSLLGDPSLNLGKSIHCNPYLDLYNGAHGTQWFFFSTKAQTDCPGLTTGQTAAWEGTLTQQGKYLDSNVHLPSDISTRVANIQNLYGSLIQEQIRIFNLKTKVRGKTVGIQQSVGCLRGKRPWSVTYTATNGSGTTEKGTVKGSANC